MDPGLLGNRYQVVRPIGTGGMTTVLEAWDHLAGRRVALKVPIGRFARDERFLARLEREAAAAAGLTHPNVAAVQAMQRDGRAGFVVTELVDGSSLRDMLAARGPLPPTGAARIAVLVCAALAAAQGNGLSHGHLTPANILLSVDGQVKLTDFRLAQATRPAATAPDPDADLWGLGACLAAMLTGREPAPDEPVRLAPGMPPELAAIVARAVGDPRSGEVYRSAAELGCDLDRFLATDRPATAAAGRPDAATAHAPPVAAATATAQLVRVSAAGPLRQATVATSTPAPARRRRGLAVAAGLVGVGLALVAAVGAVRMLGGEPTGPVAGQAPGTTPNPATTSRPASTTAPSATAPATTAPTAAPPTTSPPTVGQVLGPSQRIVPNVVGMHRRRAADALAQAQLAIQIVLVQVHDPGQVQRVIAQQPPARQPVPAGTEVTVQVGTKRPTG